MKKSVFVLASVIMVLVLVVCGAGIAEEEASAAVGLANPWTEVATAEEAADGAGVGYFLVPEENMETTGGQVNWFCFQYMEHIAEADGGIGSAELTVRKGLKQDGEDVSGDYTEYTFAWM